LRRGEVQAGQRKTAFGEIYLVLEIKGPIDLVEGLGEFFVEVEEDGAFFIDECIPWFSRTPAPRSPRRK